MGYEDLLERGEKNTENKALAEGRFVVPSIKKFYEGKKTVLKNLGKIANKLSRKKGHLLKFFTRKLATNGELEGQRAVFTGRFSQKKLEETLDEYIEEYVICPKCGKPDTKLVEKGCHVLMKCMACGAETTVD